MVLSYCYTSRTVQLALLYGYSWLSYKRISCDGMLQASFRLLTLYENSKIVFVSIISKVNFSLNTAKVLLLKKKGLSNVGHVIIPFHSIQVSREIRGQGNCRTSSDVARLCNDICACIDSRDQSFIPDRHRGRKIEISLECAKSPRRKIVFPRFAVHSCTLRRYNCRRGWNFIDFIGSTTRIVSGLGHTRRPAAGET